jgi:glycosyltransferase involved in cell wall biosynthesis
MPRLKVLQVTPFFAPHVGGVETHVREVSERLLSRGVDVSVLTTDPTGKLPARDRVGLVPVQRMAAYPRGKDWLFAPALPAAIRSEAWDVVHVQSFHTLVAPLAMATAARAGIPFIVTFHGGGGSSRLRQSARSTQMRLLSPLMRRADALVAIADFEIREYGRLLSVPPGRFVKIPNGADLPTAEAPVAAEGRLIVSVGRLERYKGHHLSVQALPHLLSSDPSVRLWLAGAGPEEQNLRRLAESLGVSDHVEIGMVDRSTLANRLVGSSLVVLLSEFESQPLAVLEAASLGVPALVADNSGMAELAAQGLATAVPLGLSPGAYAHAMFEAMSRKPELRLDGIPTWDSCADQLAALYGRIATNRSA